MARENLLKSKLKAGKRVFGTWSMLGSSLVVNAIGASEVDFIILDMEHGSMSFETVENQILSAEAAGFTPIVRLGDASEPNILHALEIGAQAILVSHVATAADAKNIVDACRYAPVGNRGLSPFTRHHGYSDLDLAAKLKSANEQMFVGVLVEGAEGLKNLDSICDVPGLDMVYVGVYDISQSLGVSGDVRHPKVIEVVRDCVRKIEAKGLIAGSVARDKEYLKLLYDSNFKFLAYRVDSAVLREGFESARGWFLELDAK